MAALALSIVSCAAPAAKAPPADNGGPASACANVGGKYLDDMKCQWPNGSVTQILSGNDATIARLSATPVRPRNPHAWALATTAIIFEFNGDRYDLLTGTVATPEGRKRGQQLLLKGWNVNNHDELLAMLNWLQFEGHRSSFEELGRRVVAMDELQFANLKAALQENDQELHRLQVVRQNYRPLGKKGILAWDLVRYIALCRWGYLAGYLPEMDAWDLIMPAALRLQQTFSSWQDLQNDFLIGREFWSAKQTQETGGRFRSIYEHFLQDSNSPWNVNPWTLELGVATPLAIVAY